MLLVLLMLGSGLLMRSGPTVDGGVSPKDGRGLGARPEAPLQPQPLATSTATVRQLSVEGRALLALLACEPLCGNVQALTPASYGEGKACSFQRILRLYFAVNSDL